MRTLLEKTIVHLLNGDQGKAEALLHKFMVERAREIHESLRNEDAQLNEGWDNEIQEEEYFDDDDLAHDDSADVNAVADASPDAVDGDPSMGGEAPDMDGVADQLERDD